MKLVGLDLETRLITDADPTPPIISLQVCEEGGKPWMVCKADKDRMPWGAYLRALMDDYDKLVIHNVGFDLRVLIREDPSLAAPIIDWIEQGRISCTYTREILLAIRRGDRAQRYHERLFNLGACAASYATVFLDKDSYWRLNYESIENLPQSEWPSDAVEYALEDVEVMPKIFRGQEDELQRLASIDGQPAVLGDERMQVGACLTFGFMEEAGISSDPAKVAKLGRTVSRKMAKDESSLIEAGYLKSKRGCRECNARDRTLKAAKRPVRGCKHRTDTGIAGNTGLVKARVLDLCLRNNLPLPLTDSAHKAGPNDPDWKYISISKDVLSDFPDDPLLAAYGDRKGEEKLLGYINGPLIQAAGQHPFRARWHFLGASTGRASCGGSELPGNLMNPPRAPGFRECFRARKGNVLAACDIVGAELRCLSQICLDNFGFSRMAEMLNSGIDQHAALGAAILGIPYDNFLSRLKDGDPDAKEARHAAKQCNFGLPGGMGIGVFQKTLRRSGLIKSESECAEYKRLWFETFPEMRMYLQRASNLADDFGPKIVITSKSNRVRGQIKYTQAANTPFQAMTADIVKCAMWMAFAFQHLKKHVHHPLHGTQTVIMLHDELIIEGSAERGHEMVLALHDVMMKALSLFTPDVKPAGDYALMTNWSKEAKLLKDENGRIIPWRP